MIKLTKINGDIFYLNPHQIEKIEMTADTIITMQSQNQFVVKEKIDEINREIIEYRSKIGYSAQE